MLLRLFSLVKVEKVEKRLTAWLELSPASRLFLRLVKLFTYMMFIAHVTACVWYLIAFTEQDEENGWIHLAGIQDEPWSSSLLTAYYWSFTTLTTVGYVMQRLCRIVPMCMCTCCWCVFLCCCHCL